MTGILTDTRMQEIDAYIAAHRGEITETLMRLVRIPSVRSAAEKDAPYGVPCADFLREVEKLYQEMGLSPHIVPESGYITALYGKGEKTLGIFAHGDVVPPGEGWLYTEPFQPVIKDGFMIGRGCNDDKSGLVQMLYATKMIEELGLPLRNKLLLFTGTNEESGMADVMDFKENEKMPDASIVPDGEYPFYSGEKGRVTFWFQNERKSKAILAFTGGDSFNRVLDTAEALIETTPLRKKEIEEKISGKDAFFLTEKDGALHLTAKGLTAHAASPEKGINAAYILAQLLADCDSLLEDDRMLMWETADILKTHYGEALGINGEDSVFGKLTCVNGMVKTEGGKLSLSFDVRYGLQITGEEILEKAKTAKAGWQVTDAEGSDGYNLENTHPVAMALRRAYASVSGDDREGKKMPAGTYARHLQNAFSIGTVAEYKGKADFPEGHGGVHQPDEAISVDGFLEGLKILICMILEVDSIL